MQKDLTRLTRELRKETCPQRVIDNALRRIAAETPPTSPLRYAVPVILAGAVLVGALLLRSWVNGNNDARDREWVQQQAQHRVQVARQAETALALIGTALLDAGIHSETALSDHAIPPVRNGLETAKNKLLRRTEL